MRVRAPPYGYNLFRKVIKTAFIDLDLQHIFLHTFIIHGPDQSVSNTSSLDPIDIGFVSQDIGLETQEQSKSINASNTATSLS